MGSQICGGYRLHSTCPWRLGAQNHLRQVLMYLDMCPLQQPEFYLGNAAGKFDAQGDLSDEDNCAPHPGTMDGVCETDPFAWFTSAPRTPYAAREHTRDQ